MNLYTPSNGLLETHVTWKDIEEDMQRELGTDAFFGPNKSATNIGEGNGYMSRIGLIKPDWQQKDKELPEKFVVKIACQLAMQKFTSELPEGADVENFFDSSEFKDSWEDVQKRAHNAEVTVYNHLKKLPLGEIPCPKILRAVATLEALSLNFMPEEKSQFTEKHFTEVFAPFFTEEILGNFMKMFRGFENGIFAEKVDKLQEAIPDLMDLLAMDRLPDEMGRLTTRH
ncbi:hypothetical protein NECAME_08271 [Necator americanus]|uniref:Uncharacterized protein n=1 Tax=Necator americanus TaxID=51031 RepID=W2TK18_NECAM|nr:hypothetical protein NECAME_08271 [Necator americanus]ETN81969.1 hypothetical protein NECAME_08271 [Necator americanus]